MPTTKPLFDGVEQTQLVIDGHDTLVPLRYHSGTAMFGVFAARSRALSAKAPDTSLRPDSRVCCSPSPRPAARRTRFADRS